MPEKLDKAALMARKEELEMRKLEAEVLQLEELDVKRRTQIRVTEMRDGNMAESKANADREQSNCTHLKGGMGLEGYKGAGTDAADYSVQKHTYSTGVTFVHCLRCFKEWRPGDEDYQKALRFPTKNTPSSGAIWNIPAKKAV